MTLRSFQGEKALFLGNGIHRTGNNRGVSWGGLLQKIAEYYHIPCDLQNPFKPFPLLFEEILYTKEGRNNFESKLKNLKTRISNILLKDAGNLIDNEIHRGFMNCNASEILTTNYDYNLEMSVCPDFMTDKNILSIKNQESKHSLYRGYKVKDKIIRHIHGELLHNRDIKISVNSYPEESIMIGFEHYSDYFLKIQHALKGESGTQKNTSKKSIITRLKNQDNFKIWTDLFFTHDVFFCGFSLDFSESHLWWLLLYREELKRKRNKSGILIDNKITFYSPQLPNNYINNKFKSHLGFDQAYNKKIVQQKAKGIADVLSSLKVEITYVACTDYRDFYLKVIDKVNKHIH